MSTAIWPRVSLISYDGEDRPVMLVEIKGATRHEALQAETLDYLREVRPVIPFGMLATRSVIKIFSGGPEPGMHLCTLDAVDVLSPYDREFGTKPIYPFYLGILVQGWLRDLAYNWKLASPPGADAIARIGLLDRLRGGTTSSGGHADGGDPLR